MAIFTVLMAAPQPSLVARIKDSFPDDHYQMSDTQWLVSSSGTVLDLTKALGIYDAADPKQTPVGIAVVFAISSYFGRGPTTLWEWLKAKMETTPRG